MSDVGQEYYDQHELESTHGHEYEYGHDRAHPHSAEQRHAPIQAYDARRVDSWCPNCQREIRAQIDEPCPHCEHYRCPHDHDGQRCQTTAETNKKVRNHHAAKHGTRYRLRLICETCNTGFIHDRGAGQNRQFCSPSCDPGRPPTDDELDALLQQYFVEEDLTISQTVAKIDGVGYARVRSRLEDIGLYQSERRLCDILSETDPDDVGSKQSTPSGDDSYKRYYSYDASDGDDPEMSGPAPIESRAGDQ